MCSRGKSLEVHRGARQGSLSRLQSRWVPLAHCCKHNDSLIITAIIAFGILNILTDWYILALPLPIVFRLHVDKRTRWGIASLFLLGGTVCIISIVRLMYAKDVETFDPSCMFMNPLD
jgi:hypothetical protein